MWKSQWIRPNEFLDATFDAKSGAELWSTGRGCVYDASLETGDVVVQSNTDCETCNAVSEQLLRGADGTVLATAKSPARQRPAFERSSGAHEPVLLGDGSARMESVDGTALGAVAGMSR